MTKGGSVINVPIKTSKVLLSQAVTRSIRKREIPERVISKLLFWKESVESLGIREARRQKGLHDEPLKGTRAGQRSIRLTGSWRAIYIESENETYLLIAVQEVTHHDY